jgi:Rrf2 family protein
MQLTRAADYAIRSMIYLATLPPGTRATLSGLASAAECPEHFLAKILQRLVRARIVSSRRGEGGGFELGRPADALSVLDVLEAIEGPLNLNFCLTAPDACERAPKCAAHAVWAEAQDAMAAVLRRATLASLAQNGSWKAHGDFVAITPPGEEGLWN